MAEHPWQQLPRYLSGYGAAALALGFLCVYPDQPAVVCASVFLFCIVLTDTHRSRIPNACVLALLVAALAWHLWQGGVGGLPTAATGFLVGLLLLLVPYLLGGIGGGDVKALAALGALLGPGAILQVFIYMGLIGGLVSLLHYLFRRNPLHLAASAGRALTVFAATRKFSALAPGPSGLSRFPYAAAIALGFYGYLGFGPIDQLLRRMLH